MQLWEETSVPQKFLILASFRFMFCEEVVEALEGHGLHFFFGLDGFK